MCGVLQADGFGGEAALDVLAFVLQPGGRATAPGPGGSAPAPPDPVVERIL